MHIEIYIDYYGKNQEQEEFPAMIYFDVFTLSYLSIVLLIICSVTAVHILLNKHEEPVSSVMWLIMVFAFPGVGVLFYLLFGINRINTRGLKIKIAHELILDDLQKSSEVSVERSTIHKALANHMNEQHEFEFIGSKNDYPEYCKMLDHLLPDTIPLKGNKISLLLDGTQAYPKMLEAIKRAKNSIHLQSYIIMNDAIGKQLFDALREKARNGVKVKVLYDRFGSWSAFSSFFFQKFIKDTPNLQIHSFSQLMPWSIQLRNHRKLIVIDGTKAFIGGINISSDNDSRSARKDRYIHDLHCEVEGPVVGELQFAFLRDWFFIRSSSTAELLKPEYFPHINACGDSIARIVASGPGLDYEATEKVYMTAVSTARNHIWLMTPYFVPDKAFIKALCNCVARGVEVRIVIPAKNNHWYIQLATKSLYQKLLEAGVRIYEKHGPFSHAKAMLIDGSWAKMGSSNCDVRSFRLNFELDFIIENGGFIHQLHNQFKTEFDASTEIYLKDVLNKSIPRQLAENICALFTPIL
jgi:cardiolipin synthase